MLLADYSWMDEGSCYIHTIFFHIFMSTEDVGKSLSFEHPSGKLDFWLDTSDTLIT